MEMDTSKGQLSYYQAAFHLSEKIWIELKLVKLCHEDSTHAQTHHTHANTLAHATRTQSHTYAHTHTQIKNYRTVFNYCSEPDETTSI